MNRFEIGLSCIVLVVFVIMVTSLPLQVSVAFTIGYLISMVLSPIIWLYILMKRLGVGLDKDTWDIDEIVKEVKYEK